MKFHMERKNIQDENQRLLKRLQESKPTYDVNQWEEDRLKNVGVVNMRLKYDYVMLPSKDLKCVTSRASLADQISCRRSGDGSILSSQLRLPKFISAKESRLQKLQQIVAKSTSRYDEDYQIEHLQKLHQSFVQGKTTPAEPDFSLPYNSNYDSGITSKRPCSQTPKNLQLDDVIEA